MGSRLARSVFDIYDPSIASAAGGGAEHSSLSEEELPNFFLPQGMGGRLPGNIIYYYIKTTNLLQLYPVSAPHPYFQSSNVPEPKNRKELRCDNMSGEGVGHFIKFTFNNIGLVDSVTYMGSEEIVMQSLWSFVGLHENYLN